MSIEITRIAAGYYLAKVSLNGIKRTIEIERVKAQYIGHGWVWKLDGVTSKQFG